MKLLRVQVSLAIWISCLFAVAASAAGQQVYVPEVGQGGKDVVWVPTPPELVEKMLDMAKVTTSDYVIDLGSGDGRNVIAAARRGARALGVEFNPDMVALSQKAAAEANVSDRATFVEGDMFEADVSQASVLALFLLPQNLERLRPKFQALPPGTRIVLNTFGFTQWAADETEKVGGTCKVWCTALLYYVPASVDGIWSLADRRLVIRQTYQNFTGFVSDDRRGRPIANGVVRGDRLMFMAGESSYTGRVAGDTIEGTVTTRGKTQPWVARRGQ